MVDVPRGTPPASDVARGVFASEQWPSVERYAELLATEGVERGLIGPREVARLWERHLLGCAVLADALDPGERSVVDVGSGAGLPGLVLALRRPDLTVTLVEPLARRTAFLELVVVELGLDRVRVVRGRAEALHGEEVFDVVTSRAVAPLPRLLGWSMPLVAPHGRLVVLKGSRVHDEVSDAAPELAAWQLAPPQVSTVGAGVVDPAATVLAVSWAAPEGVGWPLRREPSPAPRAGTEAAGRGSGGRRRRGRR